MTVSKKYRHWLGAFLLVLYTFIATPVQWWHHHASYQINNSPSTAKESKHPVILAKPSGIADDCKICSHKYSVYNDSSFSPDYLAISIYNEYTLLYKQQILSCFCSGITNKGPPAFS